MAKIRDMSKITVFCRFLHLNRLKSFYIHIPDVWGIFTLFLSMAVSFGSLTIDLLVVPWPYFIAENGHFSIAIGQKQPFFVTFKHLICHKTFCIHFSHVRGIFKLLPYPKTCFMTSKKSHNLSFYACENCHKAFKMPYLSSGRSQRTHKKTKMCVNIY